MLRLPELKEKPRPINSTYVDKNWGEPRSMNLDTLIYWVKRTPECIGILKRIATDIVTDVSFTAISPKKPLAGRPAKNISFEKEDKATTFFRLNYGKQLLTAAVIDWLMTGDAYIWKGMISDKDFKELVVRHYGLMGYDTKEYEFDIEELKKEYKQVTDEDVSMPKSLLLAPSSTITIDHDGNEVRKYIQHDKIHPGDDKHLFPDETIHLKFMEVDGKIYGFSPMESDYLAIKTINAIQDYNYNYFANGAKLQRAWLFMGNPSAELIEAHEENIKTYKSTTNAHGDIIVAGADNIKVENLNEIGEEMEFRKLAINAVGRIAFSFNMPADILSAILGADVRGTAMGSDIEDAGYNRNIMNSQLYWEDVLNTQLWIPHFGVEMHLARMFKQDQIRQIQYMSMTTPVIDWMFRHEYPVSDEYIHDMLQIDRKFITEGKIKREMEEMGQPFTPPAQKGAKQEKYAKAKESQQKPQANNQPQVGA